MNIKDELETGMSVKMMSLVDFPRTTTLGINAISGAVPVSPVSAMGPRHIVVLEASLDYPAVVIPDRGNLLDCI